MKSIGFDNRIPRLVVTLLIGSVLLYGCASMGPQDEEPDPNVVPAELDLEENQEFVSRPRLLDPIYACAKTVRVTEYIAGARLDVFMETDGSVTPIGSATINRPGPNKIDVTVTFVGGEDIFVTQTWGGASSDPSNVVVVSSHTDDYPEGLPQPRLNPTPLNECGRAVGIHDVIPGAVATVFAQNPDGLGGFDSPQPVGSVVDLPYAFISPKFEVNAKIWTQYEMCGIPSPRSPEEFVQPEPPLEKPSIEAVHENSMIAFVSGGANGANLIVSRQPGDLSVGGQPTPGGPPGYVQQVSISPKAEPMQRHTAIQTLCNSSEMSDPSDVIPCAEMPPAKIKPPIPGQTRVELTEWIADAEILVFGDGVEIGHGGGPAVKLRRPIEAGETIVVLQRLGDCDSRFVYQIDAECSNLGGDSLACSAEWPAFRHNGLRTANQTQPSALSDPNKVKRLDVGWTFSRPGFNASPVVHDGAVYIGSSDGRLYALDADDGELRWTFPDNSLDPPADPLVSQFTCNPSSFGLASSAAITSLQEGGDVAIFGAPDQGRPDDIGADGTRGVLGAGFGSGRLFAVDVETGREVWRSPEIAVLDGRQSNRDGVCDSDHENSDEEACDTAYEQRHEQIGYSSPLIYGDHVYIGVANHCDNPIQNGRIVALNKFTGSIVASFDFKATSDRGGGVWSSVAGGFGPEGVYATTGNTRAWAPGVGVVEPATNHGLSLLRLSTSDGSVVWKFQPVPFEQDGDPDWASGPTLMSASCDNLVVSTMKDGWTYAVQAGDGSADEPGISWQFPATGYPFTRGDGTSHGDSRYLMPSAAWDDVFITMTAGEMVDTDVDWGYSRLHAVNVCASQSDRVSWIVDVPDTDVGDPCPSGCPARCPAADDDPPCPESCPATCRPRPPYQLSPPSVTHGITFVGTAQGRIMAIADPSVYTTAASRCVVPGMSLVDCAAAGLQIVPAPRVIFNKSLGTAARGVRGEPVIAGGRLFYAGRSGTLFMLEPQE